MISSAHCLLGNFGAIANPQCPACRKSLSITLPSSAQTNSSIENFVKLSHLQYDVELHLLRCGIPHTCGHNPFKP